jgi:AAA ATPase domain
VELARSNPYFLLFTLAGGCTSESESISCALQRRLIPNTNNDANGFCYCRCGKALLEVIFRPLIQHIPRVELSDIMASIFIPRKVEVEIVMLLKSLEIKNYRSLEHVKLDNLGNFNVLIGRNNAGKSSVFLALSQLGQALHNGQQIPFDVLIERNQHKSIEIHLTFKLTNEERGNHIDLLIEAGIPNQKETIVNSPFFRMIQFIFRPPVGRPELTHLRETKIWAQDSKWATIQRLVSNEMVNNSEHQFVYLAPKIKDAQGALDGLALDIDTSSPRLYSMHLHINQLTNNSNPEDTIRVWLYGRLSHYFSSAYFFNPYRHSDPIVPVQLTYILSQNGSNLAQVLHSIIAEERGIHVKNCIHNRISTRAYTRWLSYPS